MARKNPRQYAAAFFDAIEAAPTASAPSIITRFVHVLKRDRMLARASRIVQEVENERNRREGNIDVTVRGAFPFTKRTLDAIGSAIETVSGAKQTHVVGTEDTALLGGAVIQYNDTRIDGSVRRRLQSLKEQMTR